MMKCLFPMIFLVLFAATPSFYARVLKPNEGSSFNVVSYGAKGDGQTDDSQAFAKAWQDLCGATQGTPTLVIPNGKSFLLQPVSFEGPCKSNTVTIELQGTLVAPKNPDSWKLSDEKGAWVLFRGINGLVINGGGTFSGQGEAWWTQYSSSVSAGRPTAVKFLGCKNLALSHTNHVNSPRNHISVDSCSDSTISNININAPEESPNTDGIDISGSSNILIENSKIQTGDDCIAINSGSNFINITGIICGPGHGISVGSLGRNGESAAVEEVHVKNCTFQGTMNGARIKTWKGGDGYAKKITFEEIILIGAKNPIIIDQNYNDYAYKGANGKAVKVSDVTYHKFTGTTASGDAITLNCDPNVGCTNIVLNDIKITSENGGKANAVCSNAQGTCTSCDPNVPCLSSYSV